MTKKELNNYLRNEAFKGYSKTTIRLLARYKNPSTDALFLLRLFQYHSSNHHKLRSIYYKNSLIRRYGIFIERNTFIDIGLSLPHPNGIVIGKCVSVGKNCTIFQHVTIGSKNEFGSKNGEQPVIGDNCTLYAGSVIVGKISVSNNTVVGANSLLISNTEANSVYAGIPAKPIKH